VRRVRLGRSGPEVAVVGLGAWVLSGAYGPADDAESQALIRRALDLGVDLIDTADEYGDGHNERLLGTASRGRRDRVVLATKVGLVPGSGSQVSVCGRPEYVRRAVTASLERLDVDHIDLLYLHRADPQVPIEETVGAMAELVAEGSVRFLGLCEVGPALLRRAHAVHPIAALQSEYSLWTRELEETVLPALAELGIGLVAFSPLGRGFLAGAVAGAGALAPHDFRRGLPRFQPESLERNRVLVSRLRKLAAEKGVTAAQLALAWVIQRGAVPIPGTRRIEHLEENVAAAGIELAPEEIARLEEAFPPGVAAGERYPEEWAALSAGGGS
jgi:aryl-alcohol dehydrogenase-like predicted oxidoreductase